MKTVVGLSTYRVVDSIIHSGGKIEKAVEYVVCQTVVYLVDGRGVLHEVVTTSRVDVVHTVIVCGCAVDVIVETLVRVEVEYLVEVGVTQ